jgi:hypothetical protein
MLQQDELYTNEQNLFAKWWSQYTYFTINGKVTYFILFHL